MTDEAPPPPQFPSWQPQFPAPEPPPWPPAEWARPAPRPRSTPRLLFLGALFTAGGLAGFGVAAGVVLTHSPSAASVGLPGSFSPGGGTSTNPGSGGGGSSSAPSGQQSSPSSIAQSVDPAVVDINGTLSGGGQVAGTGMVLTSSGLVLTNNHVIEDTTSLSLQVDGTGPTYTAKVLGTDASDDIALLQMNGASNLQTVSLGDSSSVAVGDAVVAIGNALGRGGTPQATSGSVTALNQTITAGDSVATTETLNGTIEIDAFIQPGDSGGPLVDGSGKVIGIDTAAQSAGRFGESGSNIGFAIPINSAMSIVHQIEAGHGSSTVQIGTRGVLGVEVATDQSGSGAVVDGVQSGSPAAGAGIAAGDVITSVDGQSVNGPTALQSALAGKHPGDSVSVGWTDGSGGHHSATVQLEPGPPA
ncbi:MAG TPA: trypsin-like peptidase domain-containing protein [Candidatus Dormibacteraeota bacterium]